jgi:hypothetical protein
MMVTGALFGPRAGAASIGAGFVGGEDRDFREAGLITRYSRTISAPAISSPNAVKLKNNHFGIACGFLLGGSVCCPGLVWIMAFLFSKEQEQVKKWRCWW